MTILTRNPANPNYLHANKFELNFARTPNLRYFCQTVSIPGIATSEVPMSNPFVEMYLPGEKPVYDMLNVTFIVDEELTAWKEIHDWIRAMTFPYSFDEYKQLGVLNNNRAIKPQYTDATLTLLSSANNANFEFKFFDLFPVSVSGFTMSSTDSPENIITADATFRYTLFDIKKIT